jgi:hypothetical protein
MKTSAERGELVTVLDEHYLAFLFNYLPSPPSAPAVKAMSVVVAVAYIAAVVELSFILFAHLVMLLFAQCKTHNNWLVTLLAKDSYAFKGNYTSKIAVEK